MYNMYNGISKLLGTETARSPNVDFGGEYTGILPAVFSRMIIEMSRQMSTQMNRATPGDEPPFLERFFPARSSGEEQTLGCLRLCARIEESTKSYLSFR